MWPPKDPIKRIKLQYPHINFYYIDYYNNGYIIVAEIPNIKAKMIHITKDLPYHELLSMINGF